ncbi:MAG: molybdenum cofactor guanylyltransferase [Gordonia sp.]|jgi:molybdopterin-guanine dinucleotide biosynthesis protein A|uniref:molybdenum cofactor guanylyltransferase n=2 Tax=Gordonia TaxID=2053 RepID=UPI001D8D752F|nr:molybdenum cofactor guanylyltransferase [Gordonia sp. (in: high G+C Gram-positive bacteria)]MCB1297252.1 molybdenum cofactor guanylyltransferase [Gordonia sp. (in: high G+C Gram-positive bacteria)]HMS73745.1 molybdenum cofactor guanylyltransferase [Gordonia sp. (in: high G+C Gram-positive bacteria)]
MTDSDLENGDIAETPVPISPIAGIVLAGGRSRRMGTDKASMQWPGGDAEPMLARIVRTIAERCDRVYVVATEESSAYQLLHGTGGPEAVWVTDEEPGAGPLGGLAAGLAAAAADGFGLGFVCATDMPLIGPGLIDELARGATPSTQAVIAHDARRDHPMAAIYRTLSAQVVADLVAGGERRMLAVTEALETRRVPVSDPEWLTNVNAPEDLHDLRVS